MDERIKRGSVWMDSSGNRALVRSVNVEDEILAYQVGDALKWACA